MDKKEKEIKLNTKRITFSKNIKKKALLEFAKGKSPNEVFLEILKIDPTTISKDKKYASKLLYKWKIEFCKKKERILEDVSKMSDEDILKNIENIKDDLTVDKIAIDMQRQYEENICFMRFKGEDKKNDDFLNF